jgi:hypothetical protein
MKAHAVHGHIVSSDTGSASEVLADQVHEHHISNSSHTHIGGWGVIEEVNENRNTSHTGKLIQHISIHLFYLNIVSQR